LLAIDEDEQRHRRRQHHHEIFRPQRKPQCQPEQQPVGELTAAQRAVEGKARQRPERQLDDVVVEFGGGVVEVMQPVDDQHRHQRADAADQGACRRVDQGEGGADRKLGQQVIGEVVAHQPVGDLHQPPGQGRQLVIAELPFAPVHQRLDQIERQVGIKQCRQRGPDRGVQP
jgi:hypothetical protein